MYKRIIAVAMAAVLVATAPGSGCYELLAAQAKLASIKAPLSLPKTAVNAAGHITPSGLLPLAPIASLTPLPSPIRGGQAVQASSAHLVPAAPVAKAARVLERIEKNAVLSELGQPENLGNDQILNALFTGSRRPNTGAISIDVESSASIGHLNAPPQETPAKAEELWPTLEEWVQKGLSLPMQTGRSQDWKQQAATVLRNNPDLPLEQALARAFAKVYGILEKEEAVRSYLAAEPQRDDWDKTLGPVYQFMRFAGKLYAATGNGLYVFSEGVWKKEILNSAIEKDHMEPGSLNDFGGTLYAIPSRGLFALRDGRWRKEDIPAGRVSSLSFHDGRLYAVTDTGLYMKSAEIWTKLEIPYWNDTGVYRLSVAPNGTLYLGIMSSMLYSSQDGRTWTEELPAIDAPIVNGTVFARARDGLYVKSGNGWEKTLESRLIHVVGINGKTYAATGTGLYVQEAGQWHLLTPSDYLVSYVAEMKGKLCILMTKDSPAFSLSNFFFQTDGSWKLAFRNKLYSVYELLQNGSHLLLSTDKGLWRWSFGPPGFDDRWRDPALKDISATVAQQQADGSHSGSEEPFTSDGDIVGSDGRAIFSRLTH